MTQQPDSMEKLVDFKQAYLINYGAPMTSGILRLVIPLVGGARAAMAQ